MVKFLKGIPLTTIVVTTIMAGSGIKQGHVTCITAGKDAVAVMQLVLDVPGISTLGPDEEQRHLQIGLGERRIGGRFAEPQFERDP